MFVYVVNIFPATGSPTTTLLRLHLGNKNRDSKFMDCEDKTSAIYSKASIHSCLPSVTGGVYETRKTIHRNVLIYDY